MSHAPKKKLKSIEIRRAKNGVTVRHDHEHGKPSRKNEPEPYAPPDEYAFNDRGAAADHVISHLGHIFQADEDEDPGDPEKEPDADDRKPAKKERPADAKDNVAAFHRLRKKGHLK